jgi:predicted molibdopterin-dependent oxidoreductase YjgC
MKNVMTICNYCGCGCGIYLTVTNNRVVGSYPSTNHPISRGNLCSKGWHLHQFIHSKNRLTEPLLRKNGTFVPVSWQEALDVTTQALQKSIEKYGSDSIGVLASAKCTNEENYLLQKLTRAGLGTNNIDHCARL